MTMQRKMKLIKRDLDKQIKVIRKKLKTPRGKRGVLIFIFVVTIGGFVCYKTYSTIQIKNHEKQIEMLEERKKELEEKTSPVPDMQTLEGFNDVIKTLDGYNIDPFITDIEAKPMTTTFEVLNTYKISHSKSSIGADHVQLDEKTKMVVMDEIEEDFGRSAYRMFNPLNVTQISGLSVEQFELLLPAELKGIGDKLYEAEHPKDGKYPINGLFLLAKTRLESANGTSRLAIEKNNLAGIGAREGEDKDGDGVGDITTAFYNTEPNDINNPDWQAYGESFESKDDCMDFLIDKLRSEYINPDGIWYRGDDKGVVSIFDINKKYCTMTTWSYKILDLIEKSEEQMGMDY